MKISLTTLALILLTSVAYAQDRGTAPAPKTPDANCTPAQPESGDKPDKPLSERLSDSKGVLCPPPSQDSEMNVKPPDNDARTPVIKPPPSAK